MCYHQESEKVACMYKKGFTDLLKGMCKQEGEK